MPTFIRLTDYKSSDAKEAAFFDPANRYQADQNDFEKIPGSPVAYWLSDKLINIISNNKISNIGVSSPGIRTGRDAMFIRDWQEISIKNIGLKASNYDDIKESSPLYYPITRGGKYRKWYGNLFDIIRIGNDAVEIKQICPDYRLRESRFYFQEGITWTMISSSSVSFRIVPEGVLFGNGGPCLYTENIYPQIAFMNTNVAQNILNAYNPTLNYTKSDIDNLPAINYAEFDLVQQQKLYTLTKKCIHISKEEWDSRETSWDFTRNELLKHKSDNTLENALSAYSTYWSEKFNTLHTNEEELNRLFIDIYGLQDELTPDVELKDITILKTESKIINGKLEFQKDEIIEQFISYAVGCMFGRYSLDREGLILANQGDTLQDYLERIGTTPTFEVDDDNIIPIVDEADYFSDDITDRFTEFVKTTFGPEKLQQNIAYIENALGKKIRAYFTKDFYIDHTKRYNNRPIYWFFSSPKGSFQMLVYMHRYTPDTLNHILNDYLRPFRIRLDSMRNESMRLTERVDSSAKEKADADKKIDKIDKTLHDINEYEKVLAHYAAQRIEIDLDDGVKVNYCKFKELLYEFDKKFCK